MGAINYRVHHRHTKSSASAVIDAQLPGIAICSHFPHEIKDSRLDELSLASSGHNNKLRVIAQIKIFIDEKSFGRWFCRIFRRKKLQTKVKQVGSDDAKLE